MYTLIVILIVFVSLLMCLIVLVQNSKGGGLASSFSSSNVLLGARKTTDFLEKATWTLAALMVVLSIASAFFLGGVTKQDSVAVPNATEAPLNPNNVPGFNAMPTQNETPEAAAPAAEQQPEAPAPAEAPAEAK